MRARCEAMHRIGTAAARARDMLLAGALALSAAGALAQPLADPTRPPAVALAAPGAADVPQGPVLQSVLITPTRRAAIISGELVALGGSYGDAKVVKIGEAEVVLQTGGYSETLRLYPAVDKRLAAPEKAAGASWARGARRSSK